MRNIVAAVALMAAAVGPAAASDPMDIHWSKTRSESVQNEDYLTLLAASRTLCRGNHPLATELILRILYPDNDHTPAAQARRITELRRVCAMAFQRPQACSRDRSCSIGAGIAYEPTE